MLKVLHVTQLVNHTKLQPGVFHVKLIAITAQYGKQFIG